MWWTRSTQRCCSGGYHPGGLPVVSRDVLQAHAGGQEPRHLYTCLRAPAEHGRYIADTTTHGTDQSVQAAILASGYLVEEAPSTSAITA